MQSPRVAEPRNQFSDTSNRQYLLERHFTESDVGFRPAGDLFEPLVHAPLGVGYFLVGLGSSVPIHS